MKSRGTQVRRAPSHETPERSRGAVLFARLGSTQAELAARLDVSTGIVAMWQSGKRRPGLENRQAMWERHKIPVESWDEPASPPASARPAPAAVAAPSPDGSTWGAGAVAARLGQLQELVDGLLQGLNDDERSTPVERAKVASSLATTLGVIRKLRGEELTEPRIFALPQWKRIEGVLVEALKPYPDALQAAGEALVKLEQGPHVEPHHM